MAEYQTGHIINPVTGKKTEPTLPDGQAVRLVVAALESMANANNQSLLSSLNITDGRLTTHIADWLRHLTDEQIAAIILLDGATGNIQEQISKLRHDFDNLPNFFNETYIRDYWFEMKQITTMFDSDLCIVRYDETRLDQTVMYIFKNNEWEYVTVLSVKVRNFKTEPIDLETEVTGVLPPENISPQIVADAIAYTDATLQLWADSQKPLKLYIVPTKLTETRPTANTSVPILTDGQKIVFTDFEYIATEQIVLAPAAQRQLPLIIERLVPGMRHNVYAEWGYNAGAGFVLVDKGEISFNVSSTTQNVNVSLFTPQINTFAVIETGQKLVLRLAINSTQAVLRTLNIQNNPALGQFSAYSRNGDLEISPEQMMDTFRDGFHSQGYINATLNADVLANADAITDITTAPNIIDFVPTYAALQAYNTARVKKNDAIVVVADESLNGQGGRSYYKWETVSTVDQWVWKFSEKPKATVEYVNALVGDINAVLATIVEGV